jgi:dUTP pyrophosphatase
MRGIVVRIEDWLRERVEASRARTRLKVVRVRKSVPLPFRATSGSAGFDLSAAVDVELEPFRPVKVPVGLAFEIQPGYTGKIFPRSGLGSEGVIAVDGTVDSDYRGEVRATLVWITAKAFNIRTENHGAWELVSSFGFDTTARYRIKAGERIAQLVVMPAEPVALDEVTIEDLSETERGAGGFGSTGR